MTPEQEEQVRRLLADAAKEPAAESSMPPDVAARMDRVLGDLVAERGHTSQGDDLSARRRRRRPQVLVAAAVLCLVALGGPAVLRAFTSGDAESALSGSGQDRVADSGGSSVPDIAPPAGPAPGSRQGDASPPVLRRASLQADLRRVIAAMPVPTGDAHSLGGRRSAADACAVPSSARGDDVLAVRLDGNLATLVLAAPRNGSREAAVYRCDDASTPVVRTRVRVG